MKKATKKATVIPLDDPSLEDGVGRLRIRAFPAFPEVREVDYYPAVYRWLGRHPLAGELRRWVAVTEDGEVVGHLAATPQYYRIHDERVVAHTPGDYMADPRYGFHALLLMRKFFAECENCVSCDMVPEVIGVQTRMGATDAGKLRYAAKLLNVSRLPMPPVLASVERALNLPRQGPGTSDGSPSAEGMEQPEDLDAPPTRPRAPIPPPLKSLLNGGLGVVDEALGNAFAGGRRAKILDGFDDSFDVFFEKVAASVPCVPEKDAAFLTWRYGPGSPQEPVTVLGVRDRGASGELLGYAVVRTVSGGQDGYVFDLATLPGRRDVARALLRGMARYFREAGAHIIRYRFSESPTSPAPADLLRLGYFSRDNRRNTLMVRFADAGMQKAAADIAHWSYSIGDGEATFWLR